MPAPHNPTYPRPGQQKTPRSGAPEPQDFSHIRFGEPLNPGLFDDRACSMAKKIAENKNCNKGTQLRRFYNELVLWEARLARQPEKFTEYLPFIRMLNAKAAYAKGRNLVDEKFVSLLAHTLKEVEDAKTLTICKLFWEAFTGFYKQERGDK